MKVAIVVLAIGALAAGSPKPTKLHYRNLYKPSINGIKIKPGPKIIGGQEAPPHSIPYQAFLEIYSASTGWYCSGTLISENYILTAGHCGTDAEEADITLGAHKPLQSEDTQVKSISKNVKVHEDYDSNLIMNDIAVIKLPQAVTLNDVIQTVPLPSSSDASNDYVDSTARISGWGLTDPSGDSLSDVLNYVFVKVITNDECASYYGELPESNICTSGEDGTGFCNGDSGGPLIVNGVQVGIVSFGVAKCEAGYPSAFTRVTSFLDWISANTDV